MCWPLGLPRAVGSVGTHGYSLLTPFERSLATSEESATDLDSPRWTKGNAPKLSLRLGGVLITKIVPDGLVDRWNAANAEEVRADPPEAFLSHETLMRIRLRGVRP